MKLIRGLFALIAALHTQSASAQEPLNPTSRAESHKSTRAFGDLPQASQLLNPNCMPTLFPLSHAYLRRRQGARNFLGGEAAHA